MKTFAEADKPAIYRKLRTDGWLVRSYSGGYPYKKDGIICYSSPQSPIYSYGKNYVKSKKEFSLFVWTTESDPKKIGELFDRALKSVKPGELSEVLNGIRNFQYIEVK